MLLALFFAIFATALLFAVIGTVQAALFREHLQDAADSVVLSSAVMHAQSMNFIVLVNILMAALLAILVTIKLIEGLAIIGIAAALGLSWVTFGASLVAIPPLSVLQSQMESLYQSMKPPIFDAIGILHDVADDLAAAGPAAAEVASAADIEGWKPTVDGGVVVSAGPKLPIEDDSFDRLCKEAGTLPMKIAGDALKPVGVEPVLDVLSGVMGEMTEALAAWFCGSDGKSPDPFPYSTDPVYPVAPNDCVKTKSVRDCEEAHKLEKQARPDPKTGECNEEADCSLGSPYDESVQRARAECDPTQPNPPEKYIYQTRHATVPYVWTGKSWLRGQPTFEVPELVESKEAPCWPAPGRGSVGSGYNRVVRASKDVSDVLPVCSSEQPPSSLAARVGETVSVEYIEVRHILACQRHEEKKVPLDVSGGQGGSDATSEQSPKRVLQTATLGDENFQIRAVVWGDVSRLSEDGAVRLALWGRKPANDPLARLSDLGAHAVAQAEYFYDGKEGRDAWIWNMRWRARLRRVRLPDAAIDGLRDACGAKCNSFLDDLANVAEQISH